MDFRNTTRRRPAPQAVASSLPVRTELDRRIERHVAFLVTSLVRQIHLCLEDAVENRGSLTYDQVNTAMLAALKPELAQLRHLIHVLDISRG